MNSKRGVVIAGNWKENMTISQAQGWLEQFNSLVAKSPLADKNLRIIICAPFTAIYFLKDHVEKLDALKTLVENNVLALGSQKISPSEKRARTGEIGPELLRDLDVQYVIIGHSEQRQFLNETDELITQRLNMAFNSGLTPILCVGENKTQYDAGQTTEVIIEQLKVLAGFTDEQKAKMIIAYEPVWSIGTGLTPEPKAADKIIQEIKEISGVQIVLYGGSVDELNAASFFSQSSIDGGLPGGASLKPEKFFGIIKAASDLL